LIGNVDITVNHAGISPKPNKSICMHGEWAIAFAMTKTNILFAYPHQGRELLDYEMFIVGQFTAFIDISQHGHIILLDSAIHLHVAQSNDLLLECHDRFGDLITHHIIVRVSAATASQSGPTTKKSQPNPFDLD